MKKILVAERSESLCLLFKDELSDEGYDVVTLTRPEDLIETIRQEKPDLLLMDAETAKQGIWSLLQGMRKSGYRLPIILSTTYSVSKGLPEALVDYIFVKSSNLNALKVNIGTILEYKGEPVLPERVLVGREKERRSPVQMIMPFQN
jgi:DNA-binding response OmpR family regulator